MRTGVEEWVSSCELSVCVLCVCLQLSTGTPAIQRAKDAQQCATRHSQLHTAAQARAVNQEIPTGWRGVLELLCTAATPGCKHRACLHTQPVCSQTLLTAAVHTQLLKKEGGGCGCAAQPPKSLLPPFNTP